jgi:hypothetical protein
MLKQEHIDKLKAYGFDVDGITEAIKADTEVDITIPDTIYTSEQVAEIRTKAKKESSDANIKAGKEILIKDLKSKLGLEFEGKSEDAFIEAYKEHILNEAKIKPNEQVDAEKKLRLEREKTIGELTEQLNSIKATYEADSFKNSLITSLPDNISEVLTKEQYVKLITGDLEVKKNGDTTEYYYNGKLLEDKDFKALDLKGAVNAIFAQNPSWVKQEQQQQGDKGKKPAFGDSYSKGKAFNNLKDISEYASANGINEGSEQWATLLNQAMATNKNFDLSVA